ncbi:hypothetical protein JCM3770_002682 [Rhodotorula araucariae]
MTSAAAAKKKKQAAKSKAAVTQAASGGAAMDTNTPPLEPLGPPKTTPTGGGKEKQESRGAARSKSDDEWAATDSENDMPPLTDQADKSGGAGGDEPKLRIVAFSQGTTQSKLFDFAPFEKDGVEGAFKHLGLDPGLSDSALQSEAAKLMSSEVRSISRVSGAERLPDAPQGCPDLPYQRPAGAQQRGHTKDTPARLGALLTILCSRTSLHSIPQAPSTTYSLERALRLMYLSEAQLHLTDVRLPLPADAVVASDVDLRTDTSAYEYLTDERAAHDRTRERLRGAQIALEKSTSAGAAARSKAERSEGEAKSLRGEVSRLKSEGEFLKAQAKEGYAAKDAVEREVDRLKEDVDRYRREAQDARDTLARSPPPPTPGADKKDFVVQRLSKQVVELTKQLKAKNDENLKLMLELATAGGREG